MKILIAIPSRAGNVEKRQACRDTWINWWGDQASCLFFLGGNTSTSVDEICLDCPDGFLSQKVQAICQFAFEQGYDYLFKCDDDTFVHVPRLLSSGFEHHNYIGRNCGIHAQGGAGYWLSRKAMRIVSEATKSEWPSEDRWVGRTLHEAGLRIFSDYRYSNRAIPDGNTITIHPCSSTQMREIKF